MKYLGILEISIASIKILSLSKILVWIIFFFFNLYFPKLSLYPLDCRLHHQPNAPSLDFINPQTNSRSYKPNRSHAFHVLALPSLHIASNSSNRWEWRLRCRRDSIARQRQIDMRIHRCCLIGNEDIIAATTTTMLIRFEKSPPSNRSTAIMEERPRARIYESKQTMWHWEHVRVSANNVTSRASKHSPLWKLQGILEFLHL